MRLLLGNHAAAHHGQQRRPPAQILGRGRHAVLVEVHHHPLRPQRPLQCAHPQQLGVGLPFGAHLHQHLRRRLRGLARHIEVLVCQRVQPRLAVLARQLQVAQAALADLRRLHLLVFDHRALALPLRVLHVQPAARALVVGVLFHRVRAQQHPLPPNRRAQLLMELDRRQQLPQPHLFVLLTLPALLALPLLVGHLQAGHLVQPPLPLQRLLRTGRGGLRHLPLQLRNRLQHPRMPANLVQLARGLEVVQRRLLPHRRAARAHAQRQPQPIQRSLAAGAIVRNVAPAVDLFGRLLHRPVQRRSRRRALVLPVDNHCGRLSCVAHATPLFSLSF